MKETGMFSRNRGAADGSLRFIETIKRDITLGIIQVDEKRGVLYTVDE